MTCQTSTDFVFVSGLDVCGVQSDLLGTDFSHESDQPVFTDPSPVCSGINDKSLPDPNPQK